jgi:hypothetical protein
VTVSWQCVSDSVTLQFCLDEPLVHAWPMKRVPRDVHVLVVGFLVCGNLQTNSRASQSHSGVHALADGDVHIVYAGLADLPSQPYIGQCAVEGIHEQQQASMILLPYLQAIIYETLIDCRPQKNRRTCNL